MVTEIEGLNGDEFCDMTQNFFVNDLGFNELQAKAIMKRRQGVMGTALDWAPPPLICFAYDGDPTRRLLIKTFRDEQHDSQ